MALEKYHAKRNFQQTPEPAGRANGVKSKRLVFVVQEHHASQLHYDFRLELDGVLKSWAVPKGPSLNPHDHHLAIMTEDHPYEYRTFEGVIPEGNYGAGNVIIWDEGWYEPRKGDPDKPEAAMRAGLKQGHLTFILHGKKLQGEFALIKMPHMGEEDWLLVKKGDSFASDAVVTKQDTSVKSGRRVDDIKGVARRVSSDELETYPQKARPWKATPMFATLVDDIFERPDWLFEVKWDGFRAIGSKHADEVQLYSRIGTDFMTHYPPVAEALRELKHEALLDGEIVVVDKNGLPHFEWLQNWRRDPQGILEYHVFDILWLDGHDVRNMPLIERKKLLQAVVPKSSVIRYSDHVLTRGAALFKELQKRGLEGVIAKKTASTYREGQRSRDWLKVKTHWRQEVVIGGYTEPRGSRRYIGSLLAGVYHKGKFVYVGHSGGGIPDAQRKMLLHKLQKLERQSSPFATEPKPNAPVHWVRPQLVTEMSFREWTKDGYMRQPQFEGIRADKKPTQVRRELPKTPHLASGSDKAEQTSNTRRKAPSGMASDNIEFTHLDKVFFPKHNYTKSDLITYYQAMGDVILPYLKDRPHSMFRQPDGITGEGFFQKNNEHLPPWVPSADIFSESHNDTLHWIVGGDLDTLLYMVQLGTVEINPWNSRVRHLDKPDWAVIDLDPEGRTFKDVISVAHTVKEVCDEWDTPCYPKTSGKTGIHIYIPLQAKYTHEQAKNFAHLIALEVNKRQPKLTSVERMPEKRKHKIYLDFLQNREGQTLAAPYSVRPTPDATVSTPLRWEEVTSRLKPTDFTIKNMPVRLQKVGDLWKPVMQKGIDLAQVLKRIGATGM